MFNVLFVCTGNSARSIMAEAILNTYAGDRFKAFSAGSSPAEEVHPKTLELLREAKINTEGLRSKSWNEFSGDKAPPLDLIITVCDKAKGETCPIWAGNPVTAHWGIEDPVEKWAQGDESGFRKTMRFLENRIRLLAELPDDKLEHLKLKQHLEKIAALANEVE